MKIGTREIGSPCYIIAEAGTNHHHPDLEMRWQRARALIRNAKGADAIKFQIFCADEDLFCPLEGDAARWERWNNTLLSSDRWKRLKEEAESLGMDFLASAFQHSTVGWLREMGVKAYKVASRAVSTYPYDEVPGPFLVSVNEKSLTDARENFDLKPEWYKANKFLYCVPKYPCPLEEARWKSFLTVNRGTMSQEVVTVMGMSDHSGTIWPGLDAMARGCEVLEVHFSLPDFDNGNDDKVCLSVPELKLLCKARDNFHRMGR